MTIQVRPLAGSFAAEIRGVDLRLGLSEASAVQLYEAFLAHGVLVLPGQAIDIETQLAFARIFGDLWELPEWNGARRIATRLIDDVSNLDSEGDLADKESERALLQMANLLWHSDLSSNAVAAKASLLHAVEIALEDGETEFADMRSAYEALPEAFKERLEGLIGEFSFAHARVRAANKGLDTQKLRSLVPASQHPIVRTHPETGARSLFIGGNLEHIVGLEEDESNELIEELTRIATQARFVYRHRWAVHDLVIWDNRCTLHRATPYKSDTYRRVMHRATVRDTGPTVDAGVILQPVIASHGPRPMQTPVAA
jgi:alpha-ketoglutarate-dependent 2,4-dichlorophenoxyacetate dioxygenase